MNQSLHHLDLQGGAWATCWRRWSGAWGAAGRRQPGDGVPGAWGRAWGRAAACRARGAGGGGRR
jgi:hypothetical protein